MSTTAKKRRSISNARGQGNVSRHHRSSAAGSNEERKVSVPSPAELEDYQVSDIAMNFLDAICSQGGDPQAAIRLNIEKITHSEAERFSGCLRALIREDERIVDAVESLIPIALQAARRASKLGQRAEPRRV